MNEYLGIPDKTIEDMIEHAEQEFPNESCGIVVEDKYIRYENDAVDKEEHFAINNIQYFRYYQQEVIQYIVHSHNNNDSATVSDQEMYEDKRIPHIILNLRHGQFAELFYLGVWTHFIDRPFHFGVWDCLQLVYDYYKGKFDIELPNPPRDITFISNNHLFFEEYLHELTQMEQVDLDSLREDDVLFYTHGGRIIHVGIFVSDDKVLHHWLNQKSALYNISYKRDYLKFALRIKK